MASTYFKGDLAYYTGKTARLHGGLFYEVIMAEGHMKGQIKHIVTPPAVHVKPQQLAGNTDMKQIVESLEADMQCVCDLDKWEPTRLTRHSRVCPIHKAAIAKAEHSDS